MKKTKQSSKTKKIRCNAIFQFSEIKCWLFTNTEVKPSKITSKKPSIRIVVKNLLLSLEGFFELKIDLKYEKPIKQITSRQLN